MQKYLPAIFLCIHLSAICQQNKKTINLPPSASAGQDRRINLPCLSATLYGGGSDPDGDISSYTWSKISGGPVVIKHQSISRPEIAGFKTGVYIFRLSVTDNLGATSHKNVKLLISYPPRIDAGLDQKLYVPENSTLLEAAASDRDGTIKGYRWSKVSGPAGSKVLNTFSSHTKVTNLVAGEYQYRVTVRDNMGFENSDTVKITVFAPPSEPRLQVINTIVYDAEAIANAMSFKKQTIIIQDGKGKQIYSGPNKLEAFAKYLALKSIYVVHVYCDNKKVETMKVMWSE